MKLVLNLTEVEEALANYLASEYGVVVKNVKHLDEEYEILDVLGVVAEVTGLTEDNN